jgi:hypothetical protein
VSDLAKTSGGIACPRCRAPMQEIMRIAPLRNEPGLIAYECPSCGKVTSEIRPAERTPNQSDALKLRPTGLDAAIDKDRVDYTIFSGEWEIGRIFETRGGPENRRWFWSLPINGPMMRSGHAANLDQAKAQFQ